MALLTKQLASTFNDDSYYSVDPNSRNIHNEIHGFPPAFIITRILFLLTKHIAWTGKRRSAQLGTVMPYADNAYGSKTERHVQWLWLHQ